MLNAISIVVIKFKSVTKIVSYHYYNWSNQKKYNKHNSNHHTKVLYEFNTGNVKKAKNATNSKEKHSPKTEII